MHLIRQSGCATCSSRGLRRGRTCTVETALLLPEQRRAVLCGNLEMVILSCMVESWEIFAALEGGLWGVEGSRRQRFEAGTQMVFQVLHSEADFFFYIFFFF